MGAKLGNNDISFKLGSGDCTVYLGETLIYSPEEPTFNGKWKATNVGGSVTTADCDSNSAITNGDISKYSLVSVEIGDCVTEIGDSAFNGCSNLSSVTFGSGVTTIGSWTFANCNSLTSVTIPNSVTSIGGRGFYGCTSLSSITVNAVIPPTLGGSYAFDDTNDCPIYVPSGSVDTYKAASGWSTYASRIQAIPTPSPQWVTFNNGDDISGLDVYGVKGTASDLGATFKDPTYNIYFLPDRNNFECLITSGSQYCYDELYNMNNNVEIIFSNVSCDDYYTLPSSMTVTSTNAIQLYIYQ